LYKNTRLIFCSKFKNKLRTIPASGEQQVRFKFFIQEQIFEIKLVNKTAASSAQLANYIWFHAFSSTTALSAAQAQNKNF